MLHLYTTAHEQTHCNFYFVRLIMFVIIYFVFLLLKSYDLCMSFFLRINFIEIIKHSFPCFNVCSSPSVIMCCSPNREA